MRILHTADWHVGKRLGRFDRTDDFVAVLDEIVAIADSEDVDLAIVAGDLFDRPAASIDALRLVLDTLERLARPARPVVAIAGNHDSAQLFDLLAPFLAERNVHLVGEIRPPGAGGLLRLQAGGRRALVAALPFLRLGQAVDFMKEADGWSGAYAAKVEALCAAFGAHLAEQDDAAARLLVAHLLVRGARLGGGEPGAPRGERAIHMAGAYAAAGETLSGVPRPVAGGEPVSPLPREDRGGPQYVALGHVHAPQSVPASKVPAIYAGSPLELDFGEAGEEKRVLVIDLEPGEPARPRSITLGGGRRLRRARGTWKELTDRHDLDDAFLDLTVVTEGPEPGLADRARQVFPYLVKIRVDYQRLRPEPTPRGDAPWDRLYRDYYRKTHETEAPDELVDAFREIYSEVVEAG